MKQLFLLVSGVIILLGCNKQSPDGGTSVSSSGTGVFTGGAKVNQVFRLCSDPNGQLYINAWTTLNNNDSFLFYKLNNGQWQRLGNREFLTNINSVGFDNSGNFYFADYAVYKWSGSAWSKVDAAVHDPRQGVSSIGITMAVAPSGEIYGDFEHDTTGNYSYQYSKWDGTRWNWISNPPTDNIYSVYPREMFCNNSGTLYVSSNFSNRNHWLYRYNGNNSWTQVGDPDFQFCNSPFTVDNNNNIYTAGWKRSAHTDTLRGDFIAKWNGSAWSVIPYPAIQRPNTDSTNFIYSLAADTKGNLYVAGSLMNAAGNYIIAKWDGYTWSELGNGSLKANGKIMCMTTDSKGFLYAAGLFKDTAGNAYVAKFAIGN